MNLPIDEAKIVRGLRLGDPQAWDALWDRWQEDLWRYIARMIGSDSAAVADVFQETMFAVAKTASKLHDDSRLWPWMASIAHRRVAQHWRDVSKRRCESDAGAIGAFVGIGDLPDANIERAEQASLVRSILAEMTSEYAELLVAKYIDGLSVSQIVDLCGDSVEAVRSRLARARRDFRERYDRVTAECD